MDFVSKTSRAESTAPCRLLFLRGYPSPEWLGLIGARHMVDPEFFVRFLHFKPAKDAAFNNSFPALPASTWNLLELPVITIGERKAFHGLADQVKIDNMRRETRSKIQRHHDSLRGTSNVDVASSVVRGVAILDHSCFALEQRIWICLQRQVSKGPEDAPWTRKCPH